MFSQTRTRSPRGLVSLCYQCGDTGCQLTMPVGNVLVGNSRCHVKHDDTALAVDVVSIAKTTELLLSSSVPHIELDLSQVLCKY